MAIRVRVTPYGRLCLSMAAFILIGWRVLMLPCMSAGAPVTILEALFTSTSAMCVTGLIVRSTGNDWSFAGQVVILLMIQIGGLGFMTLSSSVLMHLRKRATLGEAALIRQSLGDSAVAQLPGLLKQCLRIVLWVEGIGAALLFARFSFSLQAAGQEFWWSHLPEAAWVAVFHSISAFCNAGFSIWDSSLVAYAGDVWVNAVMSALIILGGLGFFVLADLSAWLRAGKARRGYRFRFQTRLVLVTTVALLIGGAVLIALGERSREGESAAAQFFIPLFQSVTARTAGFNTIDMNSLSLPSIGVIMVLMFIGASPGSCGGGIKTTTLAILAVLATAGFRHGKEPTFKNRTFSRVTLGSAIALFFAALIFVLLGAVFLLMIETKGVPLQQGEGRFAGLVFETISAFGTVGLSTGITPHLKAPSKMCLILLMFFGRVGPLGFISATLRQGVRPAVRYPEEHVQIG